MTVSSFGTTTSGQQAHLITLDNGQLRCSITTYGAALVSLEVPDKSGKARDVVLGFDTLTDYETQTAFIGATVGRCANRIGGSRFTLNGREYPLPANEGPNLLHGGVGFDKQIWAYEEAERGVKLSLTSPDMDQGFPGQLKASVTYTLDGTALTISYSAVSDRDTVCNLTNHSYFNLNGQGSGTAMYHTLQLNASAFTPVASSASIPTGELRPVDGTPMDFRSPTPIGLRINQEDEQLQFGGGYDHNWAIDGPAGTLRTAAVAESGESGIRMEVKTDLPGVQFYTTNGLAGVPAGKGGAIYRNRDAFCLETQFFPDSVNHSNFIQPILKAGALWRSQTVYAFSAKGASDHG